MTDATITEILRQHAAMLGELERLWMALILIALFGLLGILAMAFMAVWSVRQVVKRQIAVEAKWQELLTILIHTGKEHAEEHGHKRL